VAKLQKMKCFYVLLQLNYNLSINKLTTKKAVMTRKNIALYCILLLVLFGCNTSTNLSTLNPLHDNKYDSEFPTISVSDELSYISKTVKKLNILAFYATYSFPYESKITQNSINDSILEVYSNNMTITHETVSGTASVVYNSNELVGLLTCAHIVDFNDTIYSYYINENNHVQTISIKIRQQNHISGLPTGESLKIAAINIDKDIALLMKKIKPEAGDNHEEIQTLNYPIGTVSDLQWGSLVYIMGYPNGNLMVTQGIASLTNKIKTGLFLSDALYNPGISGSPVFAIRDGIPNFELVGMASAAAAQESNILIPDKEIVDKTIIKTPYTGDIFVDNNKLISYGITYSVSIDEISTFIQLNKEGLIANGFEINDFFK